MTDYAIDSVVEMVRAATIEAERWYEGLDSCRR